jgi:hypothetical protein
MSNPLEILLDLSFLSLILTSALFAILQWLQPRVIAKIE